MVNVAVLGAGSWGTTLAKVFADGGNPVSLWARREELARTIQNTRENPEYLPGIELPAAIQATSNAAEALENAAIAVFGNPSRDYANLGPLTTISPLYGSRAIDLCATNDPYCSKGFDMFAHYSYVWNGMIDEAATFAARRVTGLAS